MGIHSRAARTCRCKCKKVEYTARGNSTRKEDPVVKVAPETESPITAMLRKGGCSWRGDGFNGVATTSSYSVYGVGRGLDINAEDAKPVDCFHFPCLQFGFKNKNKIKPVSFSEKEKTPPAHTEGRKQDCQTIEELYEEERRRP
ncbi:hypothetical protein D5086_024466 [Populus alba]|uniref:Uncharacterized protein n=1 Tax=Populus alba TaxID=43335 RepID=A0ACC4B5I1_POPAL